MVDGIFQRGAKTLFHFHCSGFGEGDNQNLVERNAFFANQIQASRDERMRFARARAGHDQNISARVDNFFLRLRQNFFFVRRFHYLRQSKVQTPKSKAEIRRDFGLWALDFFD